MNATIKRTPIGRVPSQIEKVDVPAAKEIWRTINVAIDDIYTKNVSHHKFEVLHRSAYKLIVHRHGDLLYNETCEAITRHLRVFLKLVLDATNDKFLDVLTSVWDDHVICTTRIKEILLYMERNYIPQVKRMPIFDLGLLLFRDTIVENAAIRSRLGSELLRRIECERSGYLIDRDCLKRALSMLMELGAHGPNVFEDIFERPFIEESRGYFHRTIEKFIHENSCSSCLRKIESMLEDEASRSQHYLPFSTERKLKHTAETELIMNNAEALVQMSQSGVAFMMKNGRNDDLKQIYDTFLRVPPTLEHIRNCVADFIKTAGASIFADAEGTKDFSKFITDILNLKAQTNDMVENCFANDNKFQTRVHQSFDEILNRDRTSAYYLALYSDEQMRNGFRSCTDKAVELSVDRMVAVLRHIRDKDIFESFYKNQLSRRLLGQKSVSEESEKLMISKLKAEYGYQFTSKLERMFSDIAVSRADLCEYRKGTAKALDCEFTILTAGYWPSQSHDDSACLAKMPAVIKESIDDFFQYYSDSHSGRRLAWQFSLGSADVRMILTGGKAYDFTLSTYQMMILALFPEKVSITFEEICVSVPIPDVELKRHLLSLCTPAMRIVNKSPAGKSINSSDIFSINSSFSSKYRRIKVPLIAIQSVSGVESRTGKAGDLNGDSIPQDVQEDRKYAIDSVIVRVMKARKTFSHNELIAEVSRQLADRFPTSPQVLKMRIESLIEREYLARDKNSANVYHYVA